RNVAEAEIRGVEAKAGLDLGALARDWNGWSLRAAAAWSRGEDVATGAPLESVDPPTASLGLAWESEAVGAELAARVVGRRDRLPEAPEGSAWFESPGHAVLDLFAHWNLAPGVRLDVGVRNLADRRCWSSGALPLVSGNSGTLDRYTAAGRSYAVNFAVEWCPFRPSPRPSTGARA